MDIVAPGVKIYTTDIRGNAGYNPPQQGSDINNREYTSLFNGTSAATPHVAGIAALMLSVRPDLTGQQVRNAIEQTARKVGGYSYATTSGRPNGTWNQEMGYGLVDAYAAVYAVAPRISGPASVCDQATYTVENLPPGATVQWSASNNSMTLQSGQGTATAIFKKNRNGASAVTARVIMEIDTLNVTSKQIWVGTPTGFNIDGPSIIMPNTSVPYHYIAEQASDNHLQGITSYSWSLSPNLGFAYGNSYQSDIYVIAYEKGDGIINYHVSNECGVCTTKYLVWISNQGISLSPNPATDVVTVQLNEAAAQTLQATQSQSKAGRIALSGVCEIQLWSATSMLRSYKTARRVFEIPVSELPAGIYFVRIIDKDGKIYTEKLIKK